MLTWLRRKANEGYAAWLCGGGFMAFHQGEFGKAVRILERAVSYDPELGRNDEVTRYLAEAWRALRRLSPFQEETEAALDVALRQVGSALIDRSLEGRDETYIRGRVHGLDVEVFIYANGEAGVQGPGVDLRFEGPDYDSGSALSAAFVAATMELLRASDRDESN